MIEAFEYTGDWWLPDKPEKKISGTLSFTPSQGAVLDLIGSFKDEHHMGVMLKPQIVLGVATNAKRITLHRCIETKSNLSSGGGWLAVKSSFQVDRVFVGAHFETEDIRLKNLFIHYSNLDEWVNISGFKMLPPVVDGSKYRVVIEYEVPDTLQITIDENSRMFIGFGVTGPTYSFVQKEASIKQKTWVKIEASEEKSFEDYLNAGHRIQDFLSLATGEPAYPLAIEGTTEANKTTMGQGKIHYPAVEVFYKLSSVPVVSKPLMPGDMLFTLADIRGRLDSALQNWFKKAELLKPVYDLYFGTLYNPRMYIESTFLSLAQAVESYHRRTMNNFELPEEQHQARMKEVLDSVPPEHKKWLQGELVYSNEPSLRGRLRELLNNFPGALDKLIPDRDFFIHKVVTTRNYLTHYDESLRQQAAVGIEELYRLVQKLKMLLEICFLKELGFASDDINALISRNSKYQHDISIA